MNGLMPRAWWLRDLIYLVVFVGILIGAIRIPLTPAGYSGVTFSLTSTGGVLLTGLVVALDISHALAPLVFGWAVLSGLSWLGLRAVFGGRPGQVKLWDRDINDN